VLRGEKIKYFSCAREANLCVDRFSQSDSSITRSRMGLGMGLAIVKSLVELHGGVVSVFSPGEGQGAVFTVKLPMVAMFVSSFVSRAATIATSMAVVDRRRSDRTRRAATQ
jgi:hypothetical protein